MNETDLYQGFLEILREEVGILRSLVDLLQEEQRGLIQGDLERIDEVSKKKETIFLKAKLLEESRTGLTEKMRVASHVEDHEMNLSRMIEAASEDHAQDLRLCQNELRELCTTVSNLSRMNARLVGHSLDFLHGSISLLNSLSGASPVYQQNGVVGQEKAASRVINRKV